MPLVYPTSDIITAGNAIADSGGATTIASGDFLVIDDDINVVSTDTNAIDFSLAIIDIDIDGDLTAFLDAIEMDFFNGTADIAFNYQISIGETGTLDSRTYGMYLGSNSHFAVRLGHINVVNAGEITSQNSPSVFMFYAATAAFSNSGTVFSLDNNFSGDNAVRFWGIEDATFNNSGLIENWQGASGASISTVVFDQATANVSGHNSGSILGGVGAIYSEATVSEVFTNTGTVRGNVEMSDTIGGTFNNSGQVLGDIDLRGGADIFDGRGGMVTGEVRGGLGDDTYIVSDDELAIVENSAEGTDLVKSSANWTLGDNFENLTLIGAQDIDGIGNGEANVITGNSGDNTLRGKLDKDTLNGDDGNDILLGGVGVDTLNGDDGDDLLRGGRNSDTLDGGDGDDILRGGRDDDTLDGGRGDDILIGGLGEDELTGGDGYDIFQFNRKADSLLGNPYDSITDFTIGEDRVDLSGIRPDLVYIGDAGFSGTAAEVRVTVSGTKNVIRVDVDGDGAWDMRVTAEGVTTMGEADFIL